MRNATKTRPRRSADARRLNDKGRRSRAVCLSSTKLEGTLAEHIAKAQVAFQSSPTGDNSSMERHRLRFRWFGTLLEFVGSAALAAVLTIRVPRHEDTSTASLGWAFTSQTLDLAIGIDLVVLENGHLDL